jgi:ApbE superfamily uncharacterized protein (UPF0280 family)
MRCSDYSERFYRKWQKPPDLTSFHVQAGETDLQIYAESNLYSQAEKLVLESRCFIEETIALHPRFRTSLKPLNIGSPHSLIREMIETSTYADVGPMAGVAGAVAEYVGRGLLGETDELIVENGGDLFIRSMHERTLLVYTGEESPFENRIRLRLRGDQKSRGVCTSSASIGHSLSLGATDATVIIATSAITADVFATAAGNMVKKPSDIEGALAFLSKQADILGALVIIGDRLGAWGDIELA